MLCLTCNTYNYTIISQVYGTSVNVYLFLDSVLSLLCNLGQAFCLCVYPSIVTTNSGAHQNAHLQDLTSDSDSAFALVTPLSMDLMCSPAENY